MQVVTNLFDIFMTFQADQDLLVFGNSILQGGLRFVECADIGLLDKDFIFDISHFHLQFNDTLLSKKFLRHIRKQYTDTKNYFSGFLFEQA